MGPLSTKRSTSGAGSVLMRAGSCRRTHVRSWLHRVPIVVGLGRWVVPPGVDLIAIERGLLGALQRPPIGHPLPGEIAQRHHIVSGQETMWCRCAISPGNGWPIGGR